MKLVYLAGPITGLNYGEANDWRQEVIQKIPASIQTLSPMRGKSVEAYARQSEDGKIKQSYEEDPLCSSKGINTRDFNDVKRADLILVNLLNSTKVSIGTVMEIAWAKAFSKPVVLLMEKGNIHDHVMLKFPCGYIVDNLEQAIHITKVVLLTDQELLRNKDGHS